MSFIGPRIKADHETVRCMMKDWCIAGLNPTACPDWPAHNKHKPPTTLPSEASLDTKGKTAYEKFKESWPAIATAASEAAAATRAAASEATAAQRSSKKRRVA